MVSKLLTWCQNSSHPRRILGGVELALAAEVFLPTNEIARKPNLDRLLGSRATTRDSNPRYPAPSLALREMLAKSCHSDTTHNRYQRS